MRIGIIDLGSNTFNLKIVDTESQAEVYVDKRPVKLLQGSGKIPRISPGGFERGIAVLDDYMNLMRDWDVERAYSFATSAIRSSENGEDFVREAYSKSGVAVNVIDGDQEARFIFEGVRQAIDLNEDPVLVMDIGGGSTEYIIGNKSEVFWAASYPLGVSRLLENLAPHDRITAEDEIAFRQHVDLIQNELYEALYQFPVQTLVGSSGSFETYYNIAAAKFDRPSIGPTDRSLNFNIFEFDQTWKMLMKMDTQERLKVPGMLPMRAEMIHLSGILIDMVLQKSVINHFFISTFALKEGVLEEVINKPEKWHASSL
ncbi:MAG: phosphatase [Bacteroidota bacterium]|nr:phosphatase [Bacteroidota bacterium]MDX5505136.1 phosphatase [Bacteroidota bacterium]